MRAQSGARRGLRRDRGRCRTDLLCRRRARPRDEPDMTASADPARVAIAGIGETRVGKVPERSSLQLHAEATLLALADAGLAPGDVDLLITANSRVKPYLYHADVVAEYLGIQPPHCLTINTGGSTSVALLQYADA